MTVDCKSAALGEVAEQCAFSASGKDQGRFGMRT
jgi:hypothetical protein